MHVPQTRIGPSAQCSQLLKDYVCLDPNRTYNHYTMPPSFMVLGHQGSMYRSVTATSRHQRCSTRSLCPLVTVYHRTSFVEYTNELLSESLDSAQGTRCHVSETGRRRGRSTSCGAVRRHPSVLSQRPAANAITTSRCRPSYYRHITTEPSGQERLKAT